MKALCWEKGSNVIECWLVMAFRWMQTKVAQFFFADSSLFHEMNQMRRRKKKKNKRRTKQLRLRGKSNNTKPNFSSPAKAREKLVCVWLVGSSRSRQRQLNFMNQNSFQFNLACCGGAHSLHLIHQSIKIAWFINGLRSPATNQFISHKSKSSWRIALSLCTIPDWRLILL